MNKNSLISVIIICAVILILGLVLLNKEDVSEKKTISSNGISTIKTLPDQASVYIRIDTLEKSADASKDKNNEISQKVMDSLLTFLDKKNIETINYNIYPEYDWSENKQTVKGYRTTNSLRVKLTDFDKLGKVIDASVDAGATGIDSINFEISDDKKSELKKQVLEKASKDAREKAEAIAKGLNARLGEIVSVQTSDYDYVPIPIYATADRGFSVAEAKQAVTDINPQELEVHANVQVSFEIK